MGEMSRRSFLKTTAGVAAAVPVLAGGWHQLLAAETPGYFEREFGITDALCRKVLAEALAKGGDFADLYFEHTISNWIILEDGKVNRAFSDVALGVGIRTVKGDQVGYGFTQELDEKTDAQCRRHRRHHRCRRPDGQTGGQLAWLKQKTIIPWKNC